MKFSIAQRFKPFSHQSGSYALLPFSNLCVEVFPALIRVYEFTSVAKKQIEEINLNVQGPVEGFTIQQDLEKGYLRVWGKSAQGYFRYRIESSSSGKPFIIIPEREPVEPSVFPNLTKLDSETDSANVLTQPTNLSFGVSKSQDWTLVNRRKKLMEILPFWFRLGQMIPFQSDPNLSVGGTSLLLQVASQSLEDKDSKKFAEALEMLYASAFEGLFVPKFEDSKNLGLHLPSVSLNDQSSPLILLTEGKKLIQRMLIDQNNHAIEILPCVPPEFHCGRMLNVNLPNVGIIDIEWSKKTIRRLRFQPTTSGQQLFCFPGNVKKFRLRRQSDGSSLFKECGTTIEFSSADRYFFDNFTS